ncbi:MAG: DUF3604 domain-containing protein [Planctomycetota bacterium]|nr:MAG: DUF3604 domain-containing protein [Planctomycetota bacterium]
MALKPKVFPVTILLLAGAGGWACGHKEEGKEALAGEQEQVQEEVAYPPTAIPENLEAMRADLAAPRHPSDGQGRVEIEQGPDKIVAGNRGSWTFLFKAGPLGIQKGGSLFFMVSPYWGWSPPQTQSAHLPGFTEVETSQAGVELEPWTVDGPLLGIRILGGDLEPGQTIRIRYGSGPGLAQADRFAEADSRFWFSVDGDGDGVRGLLKPCPSIQILAGPAARLLAFLPSTVPTGADSIRLRFAFVDARGNAGIPIEASLSLSVESAWPGLPSQWGPKDLPLGRGWIDLPVPPPGVYRLQLRDRTGLEAESNPMLVEDGRYALLWGDLQIHSSVSDGTATPTQIYDYAQNVAALDVAALTDHDHWGVEFLDQHPDLWQGTLSRADEFYRPGEFISLPGYEWTNWIYGHRHVLFFGEQRPLLSSIDPAFDTPEELWAGLRGKQALTIAHHSAGGPVAIDWTFRPDPEIEPVSEIVSVHGSSEAEDCPKRIYRPLRGNFYRDALKLGLPLGAIGSTDGHDGHPGMGHLAAPSGGLAAILAESRTREGVYEALRARRVYATNGARILMKCSLDGKRMGRILSPEEEARELTLVCWVSGTDVVDSLEIIDSGGVQMRIEGNGQKDFFLKLDLPPMPSEDFRYLRIRQKNGGMAWTSPWFGSGYRPGSP